MRTKTRFSISVATVLLAILLASTFVTVYVESNQYVNTSTPIQHVVVIFQENVSFDHYFGTYPFAANNVSSEPQFTPASGTPIPNNYVGSPALTVNNTNLANPFRLNRTQAVTCDQNHAYTAEQSAYNGGLMNQFVQSTGCGSSPTTTMGYYDGNTVTALWEYANNFVLGDNFFGTTFGPSTPGALNLISGQTNGVVGCPNIPNTVNSTNCTDFGDINPTYDNCSTGNTIAMSGQNVGDLLNAQGITWGWFEGGFAPTSRTVDGSAVCGSAHPNVAGANITDYIPHHEPFQYYQSTANPLHLPPTSVSMVGQSDQANHQYDLSWFYAAIQNGNMPAVSYLKAPAYQDGHAGYSDPLDEQTFLVNTINFIESSPYWKNTAIIITYDDSDGWYDQVMPPIVSQSNDPAHDTLLGAGLCGNATNTGSFQDQCGYGPRIPLLVISPYARSNYIFNGLSDQSSILSFIETNWNLGQIGGGSFDAKSGSLMGTFDFTHHNGQNQALFLNPTTGLPSNGQGQNGVIVYNGTTYKA